MRRNARQRVTAPRRRRRMTTKRKPSRTRCVRLPAGHIDSSDLRDGRRALFATRLRRAAQSDEKLSTHRDPASTRLEDHDADVDQDVRVESRVCDAWMENGFVRLSSAPISLTSSAAACRRRRSSASRLAPACAGAAYSRLSKRPIKSPRGRSSSRPSPSRPSHLYHSRPPLRPDQRPRRGDDGSQSHPHCSRTAFATPCRLPLSLQAHHPERVHAAPAHR